MEHRNVEYTVVEEEPRRWRWKIHLAPTAATVISEAQFPTREAAVAACLEEINNGLERSRQARDLSEAKTGHMSARRNEIPRAKSEPDRPRKNPLFGSTRLG